MSGNPVSLRPHHGICMAYFVGEGYSEGFTAHMAGVIASLTPETPVRLASAADVICGACPNNVHGSCSKPAQVAGYDRAVLGLCGLEEDSVLPFGVFAARVREKILTPGLRESVCGDCQWNHLCR